MLEWIEAAGSPVHLDFETTGLDACDPSQSAVGLGLAWRDADGDATPVYFDVRGGAPWADLAATLDRVGWLAFNVPFDGAWLRRYCGRLPRVVGDSHTAYRLLANEGYLGQSWSLESACSGVLRWPTNQKTWLDAALTRHGLTSGGRPDKSQMWRLADLEPADFGRYCGEDAYASLALWEHCVVEAAKHPQLLQYLVEEWPCQLRLLVDQQVLGLRVDRSALAGFRSTLVGRIADTEAALRAHPRVVEHVNAWEAEAAAAHHAPQVAFKRHRATADDTAALLLDATHLGYDWHFFESKSKSLKPHERAIGGYYYREEPVYTPRHVGVPAPQVNWSSDTWLRYLLYTKLYRVEPVEGSVRLRVWLDAETSVEVNPTPGGQPPCGKDILPALGEVGRLLTEYNQTEKLMSYVDSYLAASARDGRLHHTLKAPGTATGRLSGAGGVNVQQFPKVAEVLSAFGPEPGEVLVDSDIASLEPKVIAYFSRDPQYLELFASGKVHDVYLYVAMALFPDRRDAIARVYYLPDGTTSRDSVDAAKAQFKHERSVAKTVHLAAGYGAAARKMHSTMRLGGLDVTLAQVTEMRALYWRLFAGVRAWERALWAEREDRGGWVYNGRGRPMAVPDDRVKDICNLFVQSTGHDLLLTWVWHVDRLATERSVPMRPFHVNQHDATTWAVPKSRAAHAAEVLEDAYAALNAELQADVAISGSVDVGQNLWDFKG